MKKILTGPVRGSFTLLVYAVNTVVCAIPILGTAMLKLIFPVSFWRRICDKILNGLAGTWVKINKMNQRILGRVRLDVRGLDRIKKKEWSLVLSNHQSWVDILVLQNVFSGKIPFLKFFIKKELFWIPLLGQTWWALDFPFMKRYSRKFLEKYPHLKGKDMEITRRACEKFKHIPISIMNFVEGTRFSKKKRKEQDSQYRHLLNPRAGGIAHVIMAMEGRLKRILDVTIVYPEGVKNNFWNFLCGRLGDIKVKVKSIHISKDLVGDYVDDRDFRAHFQKWLNDLWEEKDRRIEALVAESRVLNPRADRPI
ncbi:Acyltransferase [Candidatus Desulfarcum epimagneticum]|uniref:Acyltransferase n=1 Tax=uncultured Desulfobacteraceae bacterium TaxID=218296 RepID=A0A484HI60_9BACT|nr:Acyltransferase [uncultured Desulfobacteraceae bacterium]